MKHNPFSVDVCLSEVTQTKRLESLCTQTDVALTPQDCERYIRYFGTAWGCDRCQTVCPHNRNPKPTTIPFFRQDLCPTLTAEEVETMTDGEFQSRAYAWRKRACIMRNLNLLEGDSAIGLPSVSVLEAIMRAVREAGAVMRSAHDPTQSPSGYMA